MDAALLSAFSALAGSAIGALSSLVTTWMTQNAQNRTTYLNQQRAKREALYSEFIDEASRLFTDALSHEMEDLSKLVHLYSIQNKIRLFASQEIVDRTKEVMEAIIAAYYAPSRKFTRAEEIISHSEETRSLARLQRKLPCGIGRLILSPVRLELTTDNPLRRLQIWKRSVCLFRSRKIESRNPFCPISGIPIVF